MEEVGTFEENLKRVPLESFLLIKQKFGPEQKPDWFIPVGLFLGSFLQGSDLLLGRHPISLKFGRVMSLIGRTSRNFRRK